MVNPAMAQVLHCNYRGLRMNSLNKSPYVSGRATLDIRMIIICTKEGAAFLIPPKDACLVVYWSEINYL